MQLYYEDAQGKDLLWESNPENKRHVSYFETRYNLSLNSETRNRQLSTKKVRVILLAFKKCRVTVKKAKSKKRTESPTGFPLKIPACGRTPRDNRIASGIGCVQSVMLSKATRKGK